MIYCFGKVAAAMCSLTVVAFAQIGGSGTVQGVVSDPTGSVIPAATVVATNIATQVRTSRPTTDAGYYVIAPLAPGEYSISANAGGFQTLVQEHVRVDALSTATVNFTLKIGTAADS